MERKGGPCMIALIDKNIATFWDTMDPQYVDKLAFKMFYIERGLIHEKKGGPALKFKNIMLNLS